MLPTTASERLRRAVAAGNFEAVEQLLTEYRAEVEADWRMATDEQRRVIARDATSLLAWIRHSLLAPRSHAQLRHMQSGRESAYTESTPQARSLVSLRG